LNVFIVYAHPSEDSFTRHIRDSFIAGLESAGHGYVLSDLYKMNFVTDMSEAPAKLVGWFDRVWTYGFAYGDNRGMKQLEKGLVIVSAGNTMEYFERTGILDAMKKVMLNDRLFDRVKTREMLVLDATTRELPDRDRDWDARLRRAFDAGRGFQPCFATDPPLDL
jgi:NAD(P)H dehydrogenase (quinone)